MGTGSFPGVKCGRGVLLTTHPLLVPRSWPSGPHPSRVKQSNRPHLEDGTGRLSRNVAAYNPRRTKISFQLRRKPEIALLWRVIWPLTDTRKLIGLLCKKGTRIWNWGFLNCDAVWSGRSVPTFLRNFLPPSSEQLVVTYKAARRHTPQQRILRTTNIVRRWSPQWRRICTSTCLPNSIGQADPYIIRNGKGNVRPRTGYQGPEVIEGVGGQRHTRPLFPRERPATHCIGGCVDPSVGLDGCGKFPFHGNSIPGPSSP